jgi:hypothetical protein
MKLVLESALPAAAGGTPARGPVGVGRSYAWVAVAAVRSLAFVFVLGRGITLRR